MTKQSENVISGGINEKAHIENERWELLRQGKISLFAETMAWVEAWRTSEASEDRLRERLEAWLASCFREGLLLDEAQQFELQASLLRMLAPKPVSDALISHLDTAASVSKTSEVGASASVSQTSEVGASSSMAQMSDVGASASVSQTSDVGASSSMAQTSEIGASASAQDGDVVVFPMVPYEEEVSAPAATEIRASVASLASEAVSGFKEDVAKLPVFAKQVASEGSVASEGLAVSSAETADVAKVPASQDVSQAASREPAVGLPTGGPIASSLYAPPQGRMPVGESSKQGSKKAKGAKTSESRGGRSGLGASEEGEKGASLSDVLPEGASDASDLTELPDLSWQERRSREDRAVMEASSWARVLQPFLAQNWLYFLGTFLVLASGFYLLSLAWEGMSTLGRQAVIWGSLATGSLAFSGLGVLLKQRAELQVAGRSFGAVSLGLLGIAGMAVGPLWSSSLPVAIGVMGGTLGVLVWGLGWLRAMDAGPTIKLSTISSGVLLGGVIFVPWFGRLGHIWGVVGVLSLGTLFFWGVVRVWGALRFGVLNWGEVWCFWREQGGFDRVRAAEGQEQPLTAQEMLFFFLPQAYLWLLLVGWSGWSLGGELWLALPYMAPLCGVVGFAMVEIGEWVRLIERGEKKARSKLQQKALRVEDAGDEGFFVWFWLGALVVAVGVVQAWGTPISLVWGAWLLGVLFARGSDVRARWSLEALSALSGVVGYVALLGVLFASSELSERWMREVWWLPMQAWWILPAGVCLVVVGRRVREQREMRGQVWPLLGALLAVYGVGVLLVNDVLRGQGQVSLGMLLAMPLYALGFLYVGELREKKSWSRLGLVLWVYGSAVIGGRVFSWGVFSGGTEDRASWSLLVFVATAALLWGVSRVFERRALLPHSRFVLDEALLWLPLVLLFFWAQQPDAMGLSNPWGWHPRTAFVWGAVGLWLYGAFFFWWSYASHSAGMARWTLVWWGLASVLLSVSVRRWLGLPLGQGGGALVVMCVSFVLFELGMRWRGGSRAKGKWLRLPWVVGGDGALFAGGVGITEGAQGGGQRGELKHGVAEIAEDGGVWSRPLLEAAYVAWLVGLLMLFRVVGRGIEGRGLALAVLCLGVVFAWQVAWRHQSEAMGLVGFVLSGAAWSVAWLWPHLLGAQMEQPRVWWGVLGIAGGFWAAWSVVLWGVYGWKGRIDERGDWKGVLQIAIEILPLFGMIWMVGLGYLTVRAIKESGGVSVGWLFAGWGGSALLWYGMAWVMRRWLWVWLGASSLLVCWVLPWWNGLSWPGLLVCAMGGVLVLFALGSWGGWKRKTADIGVLLESGQAWLKVRSAGAELWGEGLRVYGLAWCLLSLPGLWWFWREGWMAGGLAGLGLGMSILPMFWEGWQGSGSSLNPLSYGWFGLSLFAAGVGCTVGLFGALPGSWQPVGVWLWLSSFGVVSSWVALFVMLCVGLRDRRSLRLDWVSRRWGMCSQGQPEEGVGWGWLHLGQVSEWMFVGAASVGAVCFGMAWWGDRAASVWLLWSVLPWVASVWLRPREVTATVVGGMMLWGWWWGAATGWAVWAVVWSTLLPLWLVGSSYWREKPLSQLNESVGWTGILGGMSFGVGVVSVLAGIWPSLGSAWLGCVGSLGVATLYQVGMWIARWQGGRLEPLFEMVAWGRASEDEGHAGRWGTAWQSLRDLYKTAMVVGSGFALWWLWLSWPNGGVVLALFLVPALLDVGQSFQRFSWTWMMMALSLWGLHFVPYWMQKESWSVWLWSVWALGALWLAAESTAAALWHGLRERGSLRMVWALWHIRGLSASMSLFFAGCGILLYAALLAGFVLEPIGYPLEVSVYWLKDARALPWWIWLLVPVLYAVMVFQLRRRSALFWAEGAIFLSPLVMGAVLGGRSWRALAVECAVGVWLLILGGLLWWVRAQGARMREQAWGDGQNNANSSERADVLEEAAEAWTPTSIYRLYYKEGAEPAWLRELTAFASGLEGASARMLEQRLWVFLWELPLLGALWLGARNGIARLGGLMGALGLGVMFAFVPASISVGGGGFWGVCLLCVGSAVFVRVRPWRSLWALGAAVFGLMVFGGLWDGLFGAGPLAMGGILGMGLVCCVLAAWWLRASQLYWSVDRDGWRYGSRVESFLRIAVRGRMWHPGRGPQAWDGAEGAERWEDRNLPLVQKGYRALGFNSFVLLWLAWGMFWIASARLGSGSPLLLHGMAVLLLLMQSWLWVGWALERDRDWMAYVGFASFLGVYGYLRSVMEIGERGLDAWVFLVVGFVLLGFRELWQRMGGRLLQRVAQRISYVLPLLALLAGVWGGKTPPIASWLIAGVFYGILAHQYGLRWLAVPALGFLNVGIFLFLGQQAVSAAQWYILPLGLSMFAISGIFAMDLGHKGRNFFRVVGALAIYLTSMVQVLSFRSITDVLLLAGLAIVGMIAGIALQIRSFLVLGLGFLVADIVINLFRIGIQDRVIGMIFLFLTGILLLAAAVFFNLKREAILARIRDWQDQMASWD
ncbi:hypothetical protein L6R29_17370 [Myxococcota bacterium]|nr:hypothetical protein [Myxococcota bacterium]